MLWVKGSGGDLGSMKLDGFATLYLDKLDGLKTLYRGPEHEDEMVGYLPHCTFNLNPRAASIDTPLHGFLPYPHVDHMHPDAVIAIAASKNSRALTQEIYGDTIGWLPWRRPGFELGLMLEKFARDEPDASASSSKATASSPGGQTDAPATRRRSPPSTRRSPGSPRNARPPVFGGAARRRPNRANGAHRRAADAGDPRPDRQGREEGRPLRRCAGGAGIRQLEAARRLAALGTSCPDHFLRTKIRPLVVVNRKAPTSAAGAIADAYRADYAAYYERCKHADSPAMRDPNPVVYLVPGIGMITFARDKATARIAGEFYRNAINVMRGASTVDVYGVAVELAGMRAIRGDRAGCRGRQFHPGCITRLSDAAAVALT